MFSSTSALGRARSAIHKKSYGDVGLIKGKKAPLPEGLPPRSPLVDKTQDANIPYTAESAESVHDQFDSTPVYGRAAVIAAAAADRDILPVDTKLRVYWSGQDEWFETKVLGHRAQVINDQVINGEKVHGFLNFKHQCEYDGGFIEHDLANEEYEVIDLVPMAKPAEETQGKYAQNFPPPKTEADRVWEEDDLREKREIAEFEAVNLQV